MSPVQNVTKSNLLGFGRKKFWKRGKFTEFHFEQVLSLKLSINDVPIRQKIKAFFEHVH